MRKNTKYILALIVLCYFFFIFGNSTLSLTDPDEIFYTLTAKEMVQQNSWMTPYLFDQPQFEKPILTYWMLRIAFLIWGITPFAARFFPAFFASLGVLAVYFLSRIMFDDRKKAFLSALIIMSGGLYVGLGRTVFTDMIFSVFIMLALGFFFWGYADRSKKSLGIILFFTMSALAVLTKGPLGIGVPFLIIFVFLAIRKEIRYLLSASFAWGLLIFILISFPWYILMTVKYGRSFIDEFFYNDHLRRYVEAEHIHNDTWYFYPMSIIGCIFPWSVFLFSGLVSLSRKIRKGLKPAHLFLACWVGVTFLIFQPAHSKLISYIFPIFFASALITGDYLFNLIIDPKRRKVLLSLSFLTWFALLLMAAGVFVASLKFPEYISSPLPIYTMIVVYCLWLISILVLFLRRRSYLAVCLFSLMVPILFSVIPFVKGNVESFASTKETAGYLMENYPVGDSTILCSKYFIRGMRFHTGKDVAFFNPYAKNLFSPHPIPFLGSDEKARDFINRQGVTYCVLKKSALEDIERISKDHGFKYRVLKVIGSQYIVEVRKKDGPYGASPWN